MPKRSEYRQGTPNWVDLQTTDQSAAKKFYTSLFGWGYDDNPVPGGGGVYSMATLNGEAVAAIAPMPPGAPEGSRRSGTPISRWTTSMRWWTRWCPGAGR
ncbi:putative 27 kDa antigen [Mycobacterium tuberculosis]|nr:putative 27 kDa antigen [Mycobacterium tuberculosis]